MTRFVFPFLLACQDESDSALVSSSGGYVESFEVECTPNETVTFDLPAEGIVVNVLGCMPSDDGRICVSSQVSTWWTSGTTSLSVECANSATEAKVIWAPL